MINEGWISLHRQVMDNKRYFAEVFTQMSAWIDLLLLANHKAGHISKRGILIEIPRGAVGYSEETLAERWKWSRGKVRRFLADLQKDNQIYRKTVQQNPNLSLLICITNYDLYQSDGTTDGQQTDNRRYRNNNEKNEKKEKKPCASPDAPDRFNIFWKAYPRKQSKKAALNTWMNHPEYSDGLFDTILTAVEKQKASPEWKKNNGQYIPYPSSWLNGERWNDEATEKKEQMGWTL